MSTWNWIDMLVVLSGLADWVLKKIWSLPNTTIVRLLRLLKLGRGMRIVRMAKVMDSLQLMLKCIASSVLTLFWSIGLLALIQCVAAMAFSQLVRTYLEDDQNLLEDRRNVFSYYGTFSRSMLTMFEVMLANWAPSCRVLVNNVNEAYSLVFMFYRCCAGFAVLNIINAVFIQQTLKIAQNDSEVMIMQKQRAQEEYTQKLRKLFVRLDTSCDGSISWDEFQALLTDHRLRMWLSALEIDTRDLSEFFQILDDGDGQITIDELIMGVSRIKGYAKAIDVAHLTALVKRIDSKLDDTLGQPVKFKQTESGSEATVKGHSAKESDTMFSILPTSPTSNDLHLPNCPLPLA